MEIKSAWLSKINWTAAISALLTLLIALGLPISEETKVQIMTVTGTLAPVIIMIARTWFTSSITPASAAKK